MTIPSTNPKATPSSNAIKLGINDFDILDQMEQATQEQDIKPAQVVLAWLLQKTGITALIVGTSKMSQLKEAVEATKIKFTDEQIKRIEQPRPHHILGHG